MLQVNHEGREDKNKRAHVCQVMSHNVGKNSSRSIMMAILSHNVGKNMPICGKTWIHHDPSISSILGQASRWRGTKAGAKLWWPLSSVASGRPVAVESKQPLPGEDHLWHPRIFNWQRTSDATLGLG